jgi:uncharacterized protein YxjI
VTLDTAALQRVEHFRVGQRLTMMVNRYDVVVADQTGRAIGPTVAVAEQKRLALRERVTVFSDDIRREVLCSFAARQVFDVGATYDVYDGGGLRIGGFRKDFAASLLRSTFHVEQPDCPDVVGRERHLLVAIARRLMEDLPLPIHFDFHVRDESDAPPVMSVTRAFALRDAYHVAINAPWLDRRIAIAMTVGLDALMAR